MVSLPQVREIVFEAIVRTNELLPPERHMEATPEAVLFGKGATLDSLGLVSLLVAVEQQVTDTCGRDITLASERAMSRERSPFRTVASLCEYVLELLDEPQNP